VKVFKRQWKRRRRKPLSTLSPNNNTLQFSSTLTKSRWLVAWCEGSSEFELLAFRRAFLLKAGAGSNDGVAIRKHEATFRERRTVMTIEEVAAIAMTCRHTLTAFTRVVVVTVVVWKAGFYTVGRQRIVPVREWKH
jgi:hypothetical protein